MIGEVGEFVHEPGIAIEFCNSIDIGPVGIHDAEGSMEVLACQRVPMRTEVRGPENDKDLGITFINDLFEAPTVCDVPAAVVDVRNQCATDRSVWYGGRFWKTTPPGRDEQEFDLFT